MTNDDLYTSLLELVEKSERRIDKTNEMIQSLAHTCARNIEMYDKHLTSLEKSRDVAQHNASKSVELNSELTKMISILREDYKTQLDALKMELHTLKEEYRHEMRDLREAYTRLAEKGSGSRADVKINM